MSADSHEMCLFCVRPRQVTFLIISLTLTELFLFPINTLKPHLRVFIAVWDLGRFHCEKNQHIESLLIGPWTGAPLFKVWPADISTYSTTPSLKPSLPEHLRNCGPGIYMRHVALLSSGIDGVYFHPLHICFFESRVDCGAEGSFCLEALPVEVSSSAQSLTVRPFVGRPAHQPSRHTLR